MLSQFSAPHFKRYLFLESLNQMDEEVRSFIAKLVWITAVLGVTASALLWGVDWGRAEQSIERVRILVTVGTLILLLIGVAPLLKSRGKDEG